jgi:tetratricopeptide (TPR) repeat protein
MRLIEQAIAAHRAGKLDESEALYRQVLALDYRDFDALHMLGILCAQRQQYDEAERLLRTALSIDKSMPQCLHNYGNVLSKLKRYEDAIRFYDQALALAPNVAPIYSDRGNAKKELGQLEDAVASYKKAIALNPNFPGALCNLAQVLLDLDRFDEAASLLRRVLALDPNNAFAVRLTGRLAFDRGELTSALAHCQRAIALKPDQADGYYDLGNTLKVLGRLKEALEAYGKAIEINPDNPAYYFGLADSMKFSPGDAHLAAMESMSAKAAGLPKLQRVNLDFALGKVYADIGDPRRSFQHLIASNAAMRTTENYNEASVFANFDRIEEVFSPELIASKAGGGEPSRRPIFVLGMPRSGTTLIEQLIASHPAVHGAGELTAFKDSVLAVRGPVGNLIPYPDFVPALDRTALGSIGTEYLKRLAALASQGERVTDKMPSNFLYAGLIHLALPNAIIIHSMRDPVDTCISCFSQLFKSGAQPHTYDLGEIGRYYRRYQRLMEHWRRVLPPGRFLDVRYEDVVADIEGQARRILAHCGLPWDDRCLAFHETDRPVRTASAVQVRQPLYKTAIGRRRGYEEFLGPLLAALGTPAERA